MALDPDPSPRFLDSVEGEIALFRAIAQARPVGMHKHFHIITLMQSIKQETGRSLTADMIWEKLADLYNLEQLDGIEAEENVRRRDRNFCSVHESFIL